MKFIVNATKEDNLDTIIEYLKFIAYSLVIVLTIKGKDIKSMYKVRSNR